MCLYPHDQGRAGFGITKLDLGSPEGLEMAPVGRAREREIPDF